MPALTLSKQAQRMPTKILTPAEISEETQIYERAVRRSAAILARVRVILQRDQVLSDATSSEE